MSEGSVDRLATRPLERKGRITGLSPDSRTPCESLLKLRAVLVLCSAARGTKGTVVADLSRGFERRGVKFSATFLYRWSRRYACFGPAGLDRLRRKDFGVPRLVHREVRSA